MLKTAKAESSFLAFYNKIKKKLNDSWLGSATAKCINKIFKMANQISYDKTVKSSETSKTGKIDSGNFIDGSMVVSVVDSLFKALINIDTRLLGLLLFGFSATGLILQFTMNKYGNLFVLFELLLFILSIMLILIKRSLRLIYEGSWIAKKLAGFFKE